ncbi:regulator of G-protein signaling 22-like [Lytechinus pictus]|uniref:regulator of G-protein signaling 22-like n=1 Tax=Lytechinus pictus TaxID=7653 RepID=UPI0030B9E77F
MSEKRLSVVPPEVTPDDLEDYLATDDLFIDYFNAFLQLSTFSKPVYFNKEYGGFEVVTDEKQSLKQRLRDLVRSQQKPNPIYKAAIAVAMAKKPPKMPWHYGEDIEEPDVKTSFKVQCLNKEQGIQWIKAERLPTFLESDCYIEYRLAKLISQTEIADKASDTPLKLLIDPAYEPFAIERPPVIEPPVVDEQAIAIRDLFVCMGDASTTQTQEWFSTVKLSASTSTTNSIGKRPSSSVGRPSSSVGRPSSSVGRPSRPDSVALTMDSGFASPSRSDALNMSLTSQDLTMDMVNDLPHKDVLFESPLRLREWRAPIGDNVCEVADIEKKGLGGAYYLDINKPEVLEEEAEEEDKASVESDESGCESQQLDKAESIDLTEIETKTDSELQEKEETLSTPSPKVIKIKNLSDIASVVVSVSLKKAVLIATEASSEDIDRYLDDNVLKVEGIQMEDLTSQWEDQLEYEVPVTPKNIKLQVPDQEAERSISRMSTTLSECKDTVGDADSLFDSDQDDDDVEEESRDSFFNKPKQTFDLMNKKGLDAFKRFLWGSEGEKCWNLWLDIDRGTMIDDQEVCRVFLSCLRDKYIKTGGDCELSSAMRERLGLKPSSVWTSMEQLAGLKSNIIKPLLLYWAPRFLMRETYQQNQSSNYLYIRQQLLTKPGPAPYPDPPTVTLLPLRPKSCCPRLRSFSLDSEPMEVHVNQHMKDPAASRPESRPASSRSHRESVKKLERRHERSKTLPIIPLTSALTTITPKPAVPHSKASVSSIPTKNKIESVNYGSSAGPCIISRVKPVPPKSAPPSTIIARRIRLEVEQNVRDEKKEVAAKEETDEEEEDEVDDDKSDASKLEGDAVSQSSDNSRHVSPGQSEKGSRPGSSTSTVVTDETDFLQMDGLLNDLYQEKQTGGFLMKFLEKREDKIAVNCLACWHELQEYHALFYMDVFKPYNLIRKAKEIQSKYVVEQCFFEVNCPAMIRYQVFRQINPPYEELFDGLEEHLLSMLLVPWLAMKDKDRSLSNKIEVLEEERQLDNIKSRHLQKLQRRLMRERIATPDFTMEGEDEETKREVYYENLAEKVPVEFRDYDFDKLIRNRMEVEHFRKFLEDNYALMDLMCWLDIESFRRTPHLDTKKRDAKAIDIKTKYLNKKYFFGPNSPATRMQQHQTMMAGGGWGKLLQDRPPNQIMLEAQKYVRERLARKWLPLFIMTDTFQERQRPHIRMEDVVDDVMANKRKRYMAIYKLLESRFVSSSHEIIALRQALINPITCQQFRKYVSLKGEHLENDVLFWLEVQKFKEMYHVHSEESLIHQKIQAILRCFINSEMGSNLQIDITPEQAEKILDKRMREMGPYVFRDAQLTVFRVLSSHWKDFQKYRTSLSEEKMLEELDRKRSKQRKKEMERARIEDEREFAKQNAPKEDDHSSGMGSSLSMRRMSTRLSSIIPGFLEDEEEEEEEKVQWKYSDYVEGLEREKQLLNGDDRASSLMSTIESLAEDPNSARWEKAAKNSQNESEKYSKGKTKSKTKEGRGKRSPASSIKDQPLTSSLGGQSDGPAKNGVKKRVTLVEPVKPPKNTPGPHGDMGTKVRGQGRQKPPGQVMQPIKSKKK